MFLTAVANVVFLQRPAQAISSYVGPHQLSTTPRSVVVAARTYLLAENAPTALRPHATTSTWTLLRQPKYIIPSTTGGFVIRRT